MSKRLETVVSFRLDETVIARLDALAALLKRPGRKPVRTDIILATLYAGLEAFERDPTLIHRAKKKPRSG